MLYLMATAVMVLVTPSLTLNSMLYPPKIDSLYQSQEELLYENMLARGKADSGRVFIYSPAGFQMNYNEVEHISSDGLVLRGWLARDTVRPKAPLLLIIPDISQGAIQFISSVKQFNSRGFHVCLMDMRGQGRSDGELYHPAGSASDVISLLSELKKLPEVSHAAILGCGTGAGIAISAVELSPFIADAIVLQNPPSALDRLIRRKALAEWGWIITPLLPPIVRAYEQKTGINTADMEYREMITQMSIPQMYVSAPPRSKKMNEETVSMYSHSNYYRKRLFIEPDSVAIPPGMAHSKSYYDKISAFVNSSLPGKFHRIRTRKLAQLEEKR